MHSIIALKRLLTCHPVFLCLFLLLTSHLISPEDLHAENLSPSSSFKAGQNSFKAGDYAHALTLFKQARAAGLNKPALFYNIGVCAYKLALYDEATKAFLHTATFPKMASLAYYNLAVVAEKQGDDDAAISWLSKVTSADQKDEKILLLAQTALSRISSKREVTVHWTRYASLSLGYDDNVAMVESDDLELTSEEEDSFTDYFAFVRSPLLGSSAIQGPYLQGSLSLRDYSELNEYDVATARFDGRYRKNAGNFQLEGGAGYSYVFWDDSSYSQSPLFNLQGRYPIGDTSSCRVRYEAKYQDILNSSYDYLQGWQHQTSLEFLTKSKYYRLFVGYSLETNNRHDKESSPRRHLINTSLELYPLDRLSVTLAASYRDSTYYLSGGDDRNEDRYETSLLLNYNLSQKWELSGRYSHTINISTSPLYDYRRNMTSINIGYIF